ASPRRQYPFRLPPGNTAALYSDGLVGNRKRGLDAGLDGLGAVAGRAPRAVVSGPRKLIDYLGEAMMTGAAQDAEGTLLLLQMPEERSSERAAGAASQGRTGRARGRI